ncbi:MAG: phosphatidate cytidylyltransferase [Rhodospirillaceae bacterium]|nr:phosphatidate cytidylyltransferase [Rhodospirillaceae bacterium]MBT5914494.1 phosphatidate cytidylyltransferase [Rhodospirillaceae bacterium]MBT7731880.1 phosphatidate cytidylyltransferase [Rhodospirillaceae bacterium]MDC1442040.1 phosphatidate cytidylyltransferase [Rhodospirillaceae bacterium]
MEKPVQVKPIVKLSQNFLVRFYSALVLVPVFGLFIVVGGTYFSLFIALLGAIMTWEMATAIFGGDRNLIVVFASVGIGVFIFLLGTKVDFFWISAVWVFFIITLLTIGGRSKLFGTTVLFLVFNLFIVIPSFLIIWLRGTEELNTVLWIVLSVVATDIGAYLTGKSIGGKKLAPKISPNKTWSGLLGGAFFSVITGFIFSWVILENQIKLMFLGLLIAIVSQMGDLLESNFKRKYLIKESSNLIPGHGGLMDRLDGHMAAVSFFALIKLVNDNVLV